MPPPLAEARVNTRSPPGWRRREALPALAAAWLAGTALLPARAAEARVIAWPPLRSVLGEELAADRWAGVPVVVVFWATWCGYCRRHNAHIDRLHRSVDPAQLRILGVALDRDPALVRRYLQQTGYGFTTVADGGALRDRFTARRVIPLTCTLSADGQLLQAIPGEMSADDVMALAPRPPR
jgi:thiol-disulfide isomerase/thioredoxin